MKMEQVSELKVKEADCGQKCGELLGKLDLNTYSLKTVQCSLFEDLNKSYATFPKSGMCVNGNVYEHRSLDITIKENDFLELPTPSKSDAKIILRRLESYQKYYSNNHQDKTLYQAQLNGLTARQTMELYEWMMGFPQNWTNKELK